MRLLLIFVFSAMLLSGCGGGGGDAGGSTQTASVTPSENTDSALVASVQSAPYAVFIAGTFVRAEVLYKPVVGQSPVVGASACTGCLPSIPIPETSQPDALIHLASTDSAVNISTIKIKRIVMIVDGKPVDIATSDTWLSLIGSNGSEAIQLIQNGINPKYFAVEIQDSTAKRMWLAATLMPNSASHRVYTQGAFGGDHEAPLFQQQVLKSAFDWSGGSTSLATLLLKYGAQVSEQDVMNGMLIYGDTAKIIERKGFSLLDMKLYLKAIGINSAGFSATSIDDPREVLATANTAIIIPIQLMGITHFAILSGMDQQFAYIASSRFGNVAVPMMDFADAWAANSNGYRTLFVLYIPENWSMPNL